MTKDTFKGRSNDSGSLNRYTYAQGDPVNLVDPTGHDVGAPGMDLGVYTEYQKLGLHPTGSYDTPMPSAVAAQVIRSTAERASDGAITNKVINKLGDTKVHV